MKYYIEVGANDGRSQVRSNKDNMDDWTGILIEADPRAYGSLVSNRSNKNKFFKCAVVSEDYKEETITLWYRDNGPQASLGSTAKEKFRWTMETMGSNDKEFIVQARTIGSILDELEVSEIQEFYLDVEGSEIDALLGIDPCKISINNLEVEIHSISPEDFEQELSTITEICSKFELEKINTIREDGNPKVIFKKG